MEIHAAQTLKLRSQECKCLLQFGKIRVHGKPHANRRGDVFSQVVQLLFAGIAQGCIYGLIALGFVLIYKATETVSFAQGELMMLGAFCGLAAMTCWACRSGSRAARRRRDGGVRRAARARS